MNQQPILQASQVSKSYGRRSVLKDVNLCVDAGKCVVLMGSNGAGKTTLTHILQGLITNYTGYVSVLGKTYDHHRKEILKQMGVLMQETHLYKRYTVKETLNLFASFYRQSLNLEKIIDDFDLTDKQDEYLKNLSGGQKQKLYLATALVHKPKILFLDEPTTGLDIESKKQIWKRITTLKDQGCAVLVTTHYIEEAEHLADRIAILHNGQILAMGDLSQLIDEYAPQSSTSFRFQGFMDPYKTFIQSLSHHQAVNQVAADGAHHIKILWNSPSPSLEMIADVMRPIESHIQSLTIRRGCLEDVYMSLTGKVIHEDGSL